MARREPASHLIHVLDEAALGQVAEYFRVLAEPQRLKILSALRGGERNVSELAEAVGSGQANVSKHLSVLAKLGFVARESRGTAVYYSVADASVYELCDLVCGQIARRLTEQAGLLSSFRARR